jgi:hypothetical protein
MSMLRRRGHAPGEPGQFAPVGGVAHHGRKPIRINIKARPQIAEVVCHHLRQIADRLLVGGQVVEIADGTILRALAGSSAGSITRQDEQDIPRSFC